MERLQKVLAQAGIASRRAAEQIILAGRVRVDGRIVRELGTQVDPRTSRVEVDGNKIVAEKLVYIVLHKPRGVVCTLSDPEGRPTIRELLKEAGARVVPVGRLDFHTSGALICTNDGDFAQGLAHPKREVPKVYVAKVQGTVDDDALEKFGDSIEIDGRTTQPAQVRRLRFEGDKTWLEITLREGRNRQVRRLGEATGFPVMRLARLSHAGVTSDDLRPGQWRPLSLDELVDLKKNYGVPKKVRAPQVDATEIRTVNGKRVRPDIHGDIHKPSSRQTKLMSEAKAAQAAEAAKEAARQARNERRPSRGGARRPQGEPRRVDAEPRPDRDQPRNIRSRSPRAEARPEGRPSRGQPRSDARLPRGEPRNARIEARPAAGEARVSNRKAPFQGERAQSVTGRRPPFQGERAQSARHQDLNQPWKERSRSALERKPATNSAKPSTSRASKPESRNDPRARRGGKK